MRPDEHKKKKNNQYKKKHGISSKKKPDEKQDDCVKSKRVEQKRSDTEGAEPANEGQRKVAAPVSSQSSRAHLSSGIDVDSDTRFRRRQVDSNWSRYEGLEESLEENVTVRGVDFSTVDSSRSIGVGSKFSFASERSWSQDDADSKLSPSSDGDVALQQLLSLDVDHLAQSITTIPLHDRLWLDHSALEEELIAAYVAESERHKATLDRLNKANMMRDGDTSVPKGVTDDTSAQEREHGEAADSVADASDKDSEDELLSDLLSESCDISDRQSSVVIDGRNDAEGSAKKQSVYNATDSIDNSTQQTVKHSAQHSAVEHSVSVAQCNSDEQSVNADECELDELLGIVEHRSDKTVAQHKTAESHTNTVISTDTKTVKLQQPTATGPPAFTAQAKAQVKSALKDEEEFDDFLDSVLEM